MYTQETRGEVTKYSTHTVEGAASPADVLFAAAVSVAVRPPVLPPPLVPPPPLAPPAASLPPRGAGFENVK